MDSNRVATLDKIQTITGKKYHTDTTFFREIMPIANNMYSLGSSLNRFQYGMFGEVVYSKNGFAIDNTTASTYGVSLFNGSITSYESGLYGGDDNPISVWNKQTGIYGFSNNHLLSDATGNFYPSTISSYDLGRYNYIWDSAYVNHLKGTSATLSGTLEVDTLLSQASRIWSNKEIYLSSGISVGLSLNSALPFVNFRRNDSLFANIFLDGSDNRLSINSLGTNTKFGGMVDATALNVSSTSVNGIGLSLYGSLYSTYGSYLPPQYGMTFASTDLGGTYGDVSGGYATYFTMTNKSKRGWIFQVDNTNKASISDDGNMTLSGNLNADSIHTTKGASVDGNTSIGGTLTTTGAINGNTTLASTAGPTFGGLTLNGALSMGTNAITSVGAVTSSGLSSFADNGGTATIGVGDSVQVTVTGLTAATGVATVCYKRGITTAATADTIASYNITSADKLTLFGKFAWTVSYIIIKK
jgi:hypothetical protein